MATLLYRLGKTAYRRWPFFVAAWLVAMIGVATVAGTLSKPMSDAFSIPGIPSERAAALQSELFPGSADAFDQASVKVVVAAPKGEQLADRQNKAAVDSLVKELSALPQMPDGNDPASPAPADPVDAASAQQMQMTKAAQQAGADTSRRQGQRPGPLAALPGRSRRHDQLELRREDRGGRQAGDHRAAQGHDGRRARRRTHRRGQRLGHHGPAGARRQVRADRHRRGDPRPDPHLRLARRRRACPCSPLCSASASASPASPR